MDLVIRYFKYNVAYATKLRNYGGFKSSFCWLCIFFFFFLSDTNLRISQFLPASIKSVPRVSKIKGNCSLPLIAVILVADEA